MSSSAVAGISPYVRIPKEGAERIEGAFEACCCPCLVLLHAPDTHPLPLPTPQACGLRLRLP